MKRDIRINYSKISGIRTAIRTYKTALETIEDSLNQVDGKLADNKGDAVDALRQVHNEVRDDIKATKEDLEELFNLFNGFHEDMTAIIKPEHYGYTMKVGKDDILGNIETIFDCVDTIAKFRLQGDFMVETSSQGYQSTFRSPVVDSESENQQVNYRKMEQIWGIMGSYSKQLINEKEPMEQLFNNKITRYENTDDEYSYKADNLYIRHTTPEHRKEDSNKATEKAIEKSIVGAWDWATGALNDLIEVPAEGLAYGLGGAGWLISKVTGETPDCLQYSESKFYDANHYVESLKKNPYRPVEDIGQQTSDMYDKKGFAYTTAFIGAPLIPIPIKGLKKIGVTSEVVETVEVTKANNMSRYIVETGGLRNELPLTEIQIQELKNYAKRLGFPEDSIVFCGADNTNNTGLLYGQRLYVNNDVLPSITKTKNPNSLVSGKGTMAHEIIGHYETITKGTAFETQYVDIDGSIKYNSKNLALDEAQASIRAARFAPELSQSERMILIRDGLTRLKNEGIKLKDVKQSLDIHSR